MGTVPRQDVRRRCLERVQLGKEMAQEKAAITMIMNILMVNTNTDNDNNMCVCVYIYIYIE